MQESHRNKYGNVATNKLGQRVMNASRVGKIFKDVDNNEFKKEVADFIVGDLAEYLELKCPVYIHVYLEGRMLL